MTIIMGAAGSALEQVTVSGEAIADDRLGTAVAAVRFNSDGTVDKGEGGVFSQIDANTDWIIPNASAPGAYEVRLTVTSGTAPNTAGSDSVNTWLALTSPRLWELERVGIGILTGQWLIEIRLGSGPVIDSGAYAMSANVDPP